jgi:transmembrane sensor
VDELILAALQGTIEPADAARLDAWRRASPRNDGRYRDMARLWALTAQEDPLLSRVGPAPDLSARPPRASEPATGMRRVPRPARGVRPAWLAAMAAIAAVLVLAVRQPGRAPEVASVLSTSEFVTDTSEMVTARLDDGSVVRLAPQSRLRVQPVADRREVWLDGEAFFAIAPDSARPFTIRTRNGAVEVLGTRFDLRVVGSELRLVVTDGKVALTTGAERRVVSAGQMAHLQQGVPVIQSIARADTLLDWMGGFLAFQNTPLRQVARELEHRYGVRVLLPDSALASRTVTAWFTGHDLEQVLSVICSAVDAHCTLRDGVASIEP